MAVPNPVTAMSASDRQADKESIPGGATLRCATFHPFLFIFYFLRDRQTETDRQRQTDRNRERQRHRERQKQRERQRERETGQHQQQQQTLGSLALLISKANLSPKRFIVWLVQLVVRPERSVTFTKAVWR